MDKTFHYIVVSKVFFDCFCLLNIASSRTSVVCLLVCRSKLKNNGNTKNGEVRVIPALLLLSGGLGATPPTRCGEGKSTKKDTPLLGRLKLFLAVFSAYHNTSISFNSKQWNNYEMARKELYPCSTSPIKLRYSSDVIEHKG
jgi:hypothetical protein